MGVALYGTGPTLYVEAAFSAGSGFGVWGVDVWGTGTWGPDVTWTDITDYALHSSAVGGLPIAIDRAFGREVYDWNAGRCSFSLDNTDGRFSPTNLSGPYVTAGLTQVRPWTPIRIRATYAGTEYPVFRGYALSWNEAWYRGADYATVAVSCVDELGSLARYDGFEAVASGSGDGFGDRIHRVLDNANHNGPRAVDVGVNTFQATTLAQNCVSELKLAADSEGGTVWIDADGTVTAEGQEALITKTRSTVSQATFTDDGVGLKYRDVSLAYDGDRIANVVDLARAGGTQQTTGDSDSRALYGDKRYARSDLVCETDVQVAAHAVLWLKRHKAPELRMETVTVFPRADEATLFPQVLGRKPLDLITVEKTPPGGDAISRDNFISGVHHRIDLENWSCVWDQHSATEYQGAGVWGTGVWGESLWSAA